MGTTKGAKAEAEIPTPQVYPWQEAQWQALGQARGRGRLAHALLFHGPAGVGKRGFAQALAQSLLCRQPDARGHGCNRCHACRMFLAGNHPDYRLLCAEPGSKVIKVDQVREFIAWAAATSQYQGAKVMVMDEAERMGPSTANALLKTLEEPSGDAVSVLLSAAPARLPATIRSRCQRLEFGPVQGAEGAAWLAPRIGPGQDPALLLGLTGGAPLDALALAGGDALGRRAARFGELLGVVRGELDPVAVAEVWSRPPAKGAVAKQGVVDVADETLHWIVAWVQDMIRLASAGPEYCSVNPDLAPQLAELARSQGLRRLYAHLDRALRARRAVASGIALNQQLLWEDLILPWSRRRSAVDCVPTGRDRASLRRRMG